MRSKIRLAHRASWALYAWPLFLLLLVVAGCKHSERHTTDTRLQKIDEMLNADLPPGTTKQKVAFYLSSRGFATEDSRDPEGLVATVSHIDPDTLQPSSARVLFRFDAGNNLTTYELESDGNVLPMH